MTRFGMFAYPWDALQVGPERLLDDVAEMGITQLYVSACYHSGDFIAPRWKSAVAHSAEANVAHLPLPADTFRDLAARPGRIALENPGLFDELKTAGEARGIELVGWTIALHNSSLAETHPDAAIENCFGDRLPHGLCPANPRVRQYAVDMVAGLGRTGHFGRLLVESLSYLLQGHGHPHELWGVRLDPATRLLTSLCFCPSCLAAGRQAGVDGTSLRQRLARRLSQQWQSPFLVTRRPDEGLEVAHLLASDPELHAWVTMRCDVVTDLVRDCTSAASRTSMQLEVCGAVWGRPAASNWMEGIDIGRTADIADRFLLEAYYETSAELARDLDLLAGLMRPDQLAVAMPLWSTLHASRGVFDEKMDLLRDAGVSSIVFYNYSTAPEPILRWLPRHTAQQLGATQ